MYFKCYLMVFNEIFNLLLIYMYKFWILNVNNDKLKEIGNSELIML